RGAVQQLHRWDLLDQVRSSGAAPIATTTFHYGDETIAIPIKPRDGVTALYAPRRTVLDALLAGAAEAAGATVRHGVAVVDLLYDSRGRVRGVVVAGPEMPATEVACGLVIGADGTNSRIVRLLQVETEREFSHAASTLFGYVGDLDLPGYHWYYEEGAAIGSIPTNDGDTCVFAAVPPARFTDGRRGGLDRLYASVLRDVSPDLADRVRARGGPGKLRGFAGRPGYVRRVTGSGWALVGDAGCFRDPITAHGISDALREAEFLSRAVLRGTDEALAAHAVACRERVMPLFQVTDRLASFEWDLEEARAQHLTLAREMSRLAETQRAFDDSPARVA
ncbi:MAG: FAD-dependent monooxygenase, partial [Gemmatimonadales bacterium]